MRIGVVVEGVSDAKFWDKVLHKFFQGVQFDIRISKGIDRLIAEAPRHMESFRALKCTACFFVLDYDTSIRKGQPCPGKVLDLFDEAVRALATMSVDQRFVFVCVAVRGLESWYLADEEAIRTLLPEESYIAPSETGDLPGSRLRQLWQAQRGAFTKQAAAESIAPLFDPEKAINRSKSLRHFWERIERVARPGMPAWAMDQADEP